MAAAAVPGDDDAPWDFEIFERGTLAEAKERLASAVADGVLAVTPQTAHCGAELAGLRLQQPLSAREVEAVRDALLIHKVVFFREQLLDHDQHEEFASRFGPLTIGHISLGHVPSHPSIFALKATGRVPRDPTKPRRPRPLGNPLAGWHTDITAALNPPAISVLRAEAIPSVGGDTCWSNMAAAHAALSPPMQAFAEGLRAVHYPATTWPGPHARGRPSEARPGEQAIDMVTEHPLVTVHPETQERVLNCSPSFLKRIQDLSPRESETVLAMLWEHATRPEFVFRHRWSVGDVVMWDNRGTLHLGPTDLADSPRPFQRSMYRITTQGQPLRGVDGRPSVPLTGESNCKISEVSEEFRQGIWSGVGVPEPVEDRMATVLQQQQATATATGAANSSSRSAAKL